MNNYETMSKEELIERLKEDDRLLDFWEEDVHHFYDYLDDYKSNGGDCSLRYPPNEEDDKAQKAKTTFISATGEKVDICLKELIDFIEADEQEDANE